MKCQHCLWKKLCREERMPYREGCVSWLIMSIWESVKKTHGKRMEAPSGHRGSVESRANSIGG
jgi:hypothetical protein